MKTMQVQPKFLIINEIDTYQLNLVENSITINKPEDVIAKNGGIKKFFFTEVFDPEADQEEVMKQTCVPLIEELFNSSMSISYIDFLISS
jgi:hypothetical protein